MQTIREVYAKPVYDVFVAWCNAKGLHNMADLAGADLSVPAARGELPPALLSRIKVMYTAYRHQHPEDFVTRPTPPRHQPNSRPAYRRLSKENRRKLNSTSRRRHEPIRSAYSPPD